MTDSSIPQTTKKSNRVKDMTGQRFGRLLVVSCAGRRCNQAIWLCRCDCGNETTVFGQALRRDNGTKSCGCITKEVVIKTNTKHGMRNSAEYHSWRNMRAHCNNPKDHAFDRYGGRGITVCERWNSFENFFADMGHSPSSKHSIDRIDNNGNYEPSNCRWATSIEQNNNRRSNNVWTHNGQSLTITQWARQKGMDKGTLRNRVYVYGWTIERALTEPVRS